HPATVYVGLQPSAYVGRAGEALNVNVIAVDWASQTKPNQKIDLTVVSRQWVQDPKTLEWTYQSTPITKGTVTTEDKGKAVYTFTPPQAGIYEIEATTRDQRERQADTVTTLWVQGKNSVSWSRDDKKLTLVADKKSYGPGDTANILIASPFPEPVQA